MEVKQRNTMSEVSNSGSCPSARLLRMTRLGEMLNTWARLSSIAIPICMQTLLALHDRALPVASQSEGWPVVVNA